MSAALAPLIGPEQVELIHGRVSINVASRDAALRPHLMRAMGCRLSADRREVTLFLHAGTSRPVLDDLRTHRRIAVVFSEPSTNRTLQLKGEDACIEPLASGDVALVRGYIDRFADEIAGLGFVAELVKTMFDHRPEDLVAVRFTPNAAFDQTPGPRAGEVLGAGPERR